MLKMFVLAAIMTTLSIVSAAAQSANPPAVGERHDAPVRVQVNVSLFVPGPTEGDDATRVRDQTQRSFYATAAHECDLLREVLAKDCRLESLNVNLNNGNRAFGQVGQVEGYTVQGNMSFQINLK
jgi:hypothetical protein